SNPLPDFRVISSSISIYTPKRHSPGYLIILATWTGACRGCIERYTTTYIKLFPDSRILLVESKTPGPLYSYSVQQIAVEPAAQVVRDTLEEVAPTSDDNIAQSAGSPNIVVHAFAGGGTNSITNLLHAFQHDSNVPIPLAGLVLDSMGSKSGFFQNGNGLLRALPKGLQFQSV
ncbi:hypothetical protein K491DRAFT_556189, partial [Lophiostoma macrostomum CBS 122681]